MLEDLRIINSYICGVYIAWAIKKEVYIGKDEGSIHNYMRDFAPL